MEIDRKIQRAIEQYLLSSGDNAIELAKKIKSTEASINRWRNGSTKSIRNSTWLQLFPLIKTYLPHEYIWHLPDVGDTYMPTDEDYLNEKYNRRRPEIIKNFKKEVLTKKVSSTTQSDLDKEVEQIKQMINSLPPEKKQWADKVRKEKLEELKAKLKEISDV